MELTLGLSGIAIAALALFFGCAVYSATGFGIAMVAMPIALLAINDPQTAVIVVNTGGLSAGVLIALQARKDIPYKEILPIAAAGALGVPFAVTILKFVDPNIIRIVIAVFILLLAAISLKEFQGEIPYARPLGIIAGFAVGVSLPAFAVGGPLIALFLLTRNLRRQAVRAAMAFYLLVIAAFALVGYTSAGLYNAERLTLIVIVFVPSLIGFALGVLLIKRMNERIFRYVVIGVVVLSSVAVLWPEITKPA